VRRGDAPAVLRSPGIHRATFRTRRVLSSIPLLGADARALPRRFVLSGLVFSFSLKITTELSCERFRESA
jgi:hypothetical protein